MSTNEVRTSDYAASYDPEHATVAISGSVRLQSTAEYEPIIGLLTTACDGHPQVTLDLSALEFLNSSGISAISRFVINARKAGQAPLVVRGNSTIFWQTRSLSNLQKLWPALIVEMTG